MLRFSILFAVILLAFSTLEGQNQDVQNVRITTQDGTVLVGVIVSQNDKELVINTSFGESTIEKANIKSLEYMDKNELLDENYYSGSHYLFNQSGFGLKKGQSYYENTYLFLNSFGFGITDNFSLTVGAEAASILFGPQLPIVFVTPKLSFPFNGGSFSVSAPLSFGDIDGGFGAGVLQGSATFGTPSNNITLGAGIGVNLLAFSEDKLTLFQLSGIAKLSENVSFVSENYLAFIDEESEFVFSFGVRIHSKKNYNFLTISLLRPASAIDFIGIPFFSGTIALK